MVLPQDDSCDERPSVKNDTDAGIDVDDDVAVDELADAAVIFAAGGGVTGTPPSEIAVRKVDLLFERYGESHTNAVNEAIHWICVPLITWSIVAALWAAWAHSCIAFGYDTEEFFQIVDHSGGSFIEFRGEIFIAATCRLH